MTNSDRTGERLLCANYGHKVRSLKSWAMSTEAPPEGKGSTNGDPIDVDFNDETLYAPYT
jgi:hypothetical protein